MDHSPPQEFLYGGELESDRRFEKTKANLYKTELCRSFEEKGSCKYGLKCQFAHGPEELRNTHRHPRYKTEICKTFHTTGTCPYGKRCRFIHMDGIPKVWEASYPLNYLILHHDRGQQEFGTASVTELDLFLGIVEELKQKWQDPEFAPEYAYIAKYINYHRNLPEEDVLHKIHTMVASMHPSRRLPVFVSVENAQELC